jgi:hypothetical protein
VRLAGVDSSQRSVARRGPGAYGQEQSRVGRVLRRVGSSTRRRRRVGIPGGSSWLAATLRACLSVGVVTSRHSSGIVSDAACQVDGFSWNAPSGSCAARRRLGTTPSPAARAGAGQASRQRLVARPSRPRVDGCRRRSGCCHSLGVIEAVADSMLVSRRARRDAGHAALPATRGWLAAGRRRLARA